MTASSKRQRVSPAEAPEKGSGKRRDASKRLPCAYAPCGRLFAVRGSGKRQRYCCPQHGAWARKGKALSLPARACAYARCGVGFVPRRKSQLYHSAACRKLAWFDARFVRRADAV